MDGEKLESGKSPGSEKKFLLADQIAEEGKTILQEGVDKKELRKKQEIEGFFSLINRTAFQNKKTSLYKKIRDSMTQGKFIELDKNFFFDMSNIAAKINGGKLASHEEGLVFFDIKKLGQNRSFDSKANRIDLDKDGMDSYLFEGLVPKFEQLGFEVKCINKGGKQVFLFGPKERNVSPQGNGWNLAEHLMIEGKTILQEGVDKKELRKKQEVEGFFSLIERTLFQSKESSLYKKVRNSLAKGEFVSLNKSFCSSIIKIAAKLNNGNVVGENHEGLILFNLKEWGNNADYFDEEKNTIDTDKAYLFKGLVPKFEELGFKVNYNTDGGKQRFSFGRQNK